MDEPIETLFVFTTRVGAWNHVLDGGPDTRQNAQFLWKEGPIVSVGTFCPELCKNG